MKVVIVVFFDVLKKERLIVGLFVCCFFSTVAILVEGSSIREISRDITSAERVSDVDLTRDNGRTAAAAHVVGRRIKIAAIEADSYFMAKPTPDGDTYSGYLVDLVEEIWRQFPLIDYEWVIKEDGESTKRKNTISAELTSMLMTEKIDVAAVSWNLIGSSNGRRLSSTRPYLKSTLSLLVRTSFLPPDRRHPWSLEDLLNQTTSQTTLQFGTTSSAVAQFIKTSNRTLYYQLWNDKTPQSTEYPLEEALKKVRVENFALIVESTDASYASSREPCDLLVLDQFTRYETSYVFATRRNETMARELDDVLARLTEQHFLSHLYEKWWQNDECTSGRQDRKSNDDEKADDESDLESYDDDTERIFFTSPVKSFKNRNNENIRNAFITDLLLSVTQSIRLTTPPATELGQSVKGLLETTSSNEPVSRSREVSESRSDVGSAIGLDASSAGMTIKSVDDDGSSVKLLSRAAAGTTSGVAHITSAEPDKPGRRSRTRQQGYHHRSKQTTTSRTTTTVISAGNERRGFSATQSPEMQEADDLVRIGRHDNMSSAYVSYRVETTRSAAASILRSERPSPVRFTVTWKSNVGTDGETHDDGGGLAHRTIYSGKNKALGGGEEAPARDGSVERQRRFTVGQKFIDEFEWFFVTHRPRTDNDDVIYDVFDDVDNEEDEQRKAFVALNRVTMMTTTTTTTKRQTTINSNSKSNAHRSSVKHFDSSPTKKSSASSSSSSSSVKLVFLPSFKAQLIFILLCNFFVCRR